MQRSKKEWSYTSTPPIRLHGAVFSYSIGTTLPFMPITKNIRHDGSSQKGSKRRNLEILTDKVKVEWRYSSTHSLTSALDGGEWSSSRPGHFTLRERAPDVHWIAGWVGPRAFLDAVVKRKIPSPRRESNPRTPII
jgi:hypothetical protein